MMIEQNNITADDVANAVGEGGSPWQNASKIRAVLGRGSLSTIQKHLDVMRQKAAAQKAAAAQPLAAPPKPPAEVFDSIWQQAWYAAQAQTLSRLNELTGERDGLAAQAAAQANYIDELTGCMDALEAAAAASVAAQAEAAAGQLETAKAAAAVAAQAESTNKAQAEALAAALASTVKAKEEAANAAAVAIRDAQIQRLEQQMIIDRLTEQLTESKALHIAQATRNPQN